MGGGALREARQEYWASVREQERACLCACVCVLLGPGRYTVRGVSRCMVSTLSEFNV